MNRPKRKIPMDVWVGVIALLMTVAAVAVSIRYGIGQGDERRIEARR